MTALAAWVFWLSLGTAFYTVAGYGVILLALARLFGRPHAPASAAPASAAPRRLEVEFLIAAHNEAAHIVAKIRNCLDQDNPDGHRLRVIVASDGSSDGTVALARAVDDPRVEVIALPRRGGKAAALNAGLARLRGDVVVFTDANSLLAPGSLRAMLRHFADPAVGGVCGRISVDADSAGSIGRAEGLYWRYDQALKAAESRLGGTIAAQGSIYALRREICAPVPPGMADDFILSVRAVDRGYRLVFEPQAVTREQVTERAGDEMRRRIRSTERGWRALMACRHLMNPLRTGFYGWQLFSHKFLRGLMPALMLLILLSSLVLSGQGWGHAAFAGLQLGGYGLAIAALLVPPLRRLPLAGSAMFFVMSNIAMLRGLIAYYRGVQTTLWRPVRD
ncbi:MAG: hypothetical protein Kow0058_03620 [Roseovarius sp.]